MVAQRFLLPDQVTTRPQFLDQLNPEMTDLQLRTAIANSALNSTDSAYRSDPVSQYYKTLARNRFRNNENALNDVYETFTPVEINYIKRMFGATTDDAVELWKALGGRVEELAEAVAQGADPVQAARGIAQEQQSGGEDYGDRMAAMANRPAASGPDRWSDVPVGGNPAPQEVYDRLDSAGLTGFLDPVGDGIGGGYYGPDFATNPNVTADYLDDLYNDGPLGPGMDSIIGVPADQAVPGVLDANKNGIMETPFGDYTKSGLVGGIAGTALGAIAGVPGIGLAGGLYGNYRDRQARSVTPQQIVELNPNMQFTAPPVQNRTALTSTSPNGTSTRSGFSNTIGSNPSQGNVGGYDYGRANERDSTGGSGWSASDSFYDNNSDLDLDGDGRIGGNYGDLGNKSNRDAYANDIGGLLDSLDGGSSNSGGGSSSGRSSSGGGSKGTRGSDGSYSYDSFSDFASDNFGGGGNDNDNDSGGCWIYSTLSDMGKIHKKYHAIIVKYHVKIQSDFSYNGYVTWSKPVSKRFKNNQWIANWFASMAPDYARAKAVRLGILKNRTWRMWYLEKAWDALNHIVGAGVYAMSYFKDDKEKTDDPKAY